MVVDMNVGSQFLAHVKFDDESGQWSEHDLESHLKGTAALSGKFAASFKNEDWGHAAGLLHDLGKYNEGFQQYIKNVSGYDPEAHLEGAPGKVDHSTAGAIYAVDRFGDQVGRILAYLIAGHHAGLPDWTHEIGIGAALSKRLSHREHLERALRAGIPDSILLAERPISFPKLANSKDFHLWIRMLFSSLVDADFLDTEAFMSPEKSQLRENKDTGLAALKVRFDAHMAALEATTIKASTFNTPVNRVRRHVLNSCREGAAQAPGFFSLTVPTGGGKTLASMAFALGHALAHGKCRIIVVIPYTSIIEQTAEVLRKVFGDKAVLEHHSNLDPERETPEGRLASENWDAPIIVTTNVQFFESLFASRTSGCRKLHNLVDSVAIFDEAQMLPPEFLKPILGVLEGLARNYGLTGLLCTATQPALSGRIGTGQAAFQGLESVRELMPDASDLARELKRVTLRLNHEAMSPVVWFDLARELAEHQQVLCIVNTRKDCRELHALMPPGTIHLSALMCAEHRSKVIKDIKNGLLSGGPVRVISTQLVEAGVDLDFPVVYRSLAGLDSMAQAAGRCNREGRLNEVGRLGEVVIFTPPNPAPPGLLRKGEEAGREMLRCHPDEVGSFDPNGFRHYFDLFYARVNSFDEKDMKGLLERDAPSGQFQFRTAATRFHLIDDEAQQSLVVWYPPQKAEIQELLDELRVKGASRGRIRRLQRFTVTMRERAFKALSARGEVMDYGGIWGQAVDGLYDPVLGLCPDGAAWNPETYVL